MVNGYEDIVKFNKDNLDAAVTAGSTFAKGVEELSREYFGFAAKSFDSVLEAGKALASVKSPAEAAALQTKLIRDNWEAALVQSRKVSEMSTVLFKGAFEPVTTRAKVALSTVAKAA
ncbi:phasin [Rhodospirillum rubrum]|uniref:phasin family protein n=1 Tax=Rhodospirillum rubrum TaxID=1085 RepID=UPI0019047459|nr:phasin family protein [Rhodospirillum rubrum]MBK1663879.1 phasin [Rhodospirillum rubrum]MBK1676718.1 phasin [Rhodospirillum rubrum]